MAPSSKRAIVFLITLKAWRRAATLYCTHILTTIATLAIFCAAGIYLKRPDFMSFINIGPLMDQPAKALIGLATMGHQTWLQQYPVNVWRAVADAAAIPDDRQHQHFCHGRAFGHSVAGFRRVPDRAAKLSNRRCVVSQSIVVAVPVRHRDRGHHACAPRRHHCVQQVSVRPFRCLYPDCTGLGALAAVGCRYVTWACRWL